MTIEFISSNYASLKYVTPTTKCCLHANTVLLICVQFTQHSTTSKH